MVVLSREADIKKVTEALPELLPALRDNPPPRRPRWDIKPSELDRLGIISGTGGERTAGEWVTRVLVEKADNVPAKLAAHPGVAERHGPRLPRIVDAC
jgi:hypothetical protein